MKKDDNFLIDRAKIISSFNQQIIGLKKQLKREIIIDSMSFNAGAPGRITVFLEEYNVKDLFPDRPYPLFNEIFFLKKIDVLYYENMNENNKFYGNLSAHFVLKGYPHKNWFNVCTLMTLYFKDEDRKVSSPMLSGFSFRFQEEEDYLRVKDFLQPIKKSFYKEIDD